MSWAIEFEPDWEKIPEVILYVISKDEMTQYQIVKAVFLADRAHLKKYGRPVTFDNYVAMKLGPVPTNIYNLLKPDHSFRDRYKEEAPWQAQPVPGSKKARLFSPRRNFNEDFLSVSDMRALDDAVGKVKKMKFMEIVDLTHADAAYKSAWSGRGHSGSPPMNWAQILGGRKSPTKEDIEYVEQLAYVG